MDGVMIEMCTMWEKTSERGNQYFFGRAGKMKVIMLKDTRNQVEGKDPKWNLMLAPVDPEPTHNAAPRLTAQDRPKPPQKWDSKANPAAPTYPQRPAQRRGRKPKQQQPEDNTPFADDSDFAGAFARGEH